MSFARILVCAVLLALAAWRARAGEGEAAGPGLASKYPLDAGLGADPDVILFDDFEAWSADGASFPAKLWGGAHKNAKSRTGAVQGKVALPPGERPGARVLEVACWQAGGGSGVGGLSKAIGNYSGASDGLGPGYDELFVRFYMKLGDGYKLPANHGGNLGGRDVTRGDSRWVGMSNTTDVAGCGYFYSGLQPYGKQGSAEGIYLGFYSYHMDKKGQWGDEYPALKKKEIAPGRWYCVERRMKLNTAEPLAADGLEELWVDGELVVRREGLRFRKVPQLHISFFTLENYYHDLPAEWTAENPLRVFYDNVVVSKKYVGPMAQAPRREATAKAEAAGSSAAAPRDEAAEKRKADDAKAAEIYRSARDAERQGMKDLAKQLYGKVVADHPDSGVAASARERLGALK